MRNPFVISFNNRVQDKNIEKIFDLFLINLKETSYQKIERVSESKIIIGDFFSLNPLDNVPWNLWIGFSRKAELSIKKNNTIVYSVDFKYGMIYLILVIIFFVLSSLIHTFPINDIYLLFLAVASAILILNLVVKIFLHWQLFNKTIKLENTYKGNYDWCDIMKGKSDKELKKIANGNTTLTIEVQKIAKEELMRRIGN